MCCHFFIFQSIICHTYENMKNCNSEYILWTHVFLSKFRVSIHVPYLHFYGNAKNWLHSRCGLKLLAPNEVVIYFRWFLSGSMIMVGHYNDAINLLLTWGYEGNEILRLLSYSRFSFMFACCLKPVFGHTDSFVSIYEYYNVYS
jgi:hypothetical protein